MDGVMTGKDLKKLLNGLTSTLNGQWTRKRTMAVQNGDIPATITDVANAALENTLNALSPGTPRIQPRDSFIRSTLDEQDRDLALDCGYPNRNPSLEQYRQLYDEEGPAARLTGVLPAESWAVYPEVYEREDSRVTQFERDWAALNKRIPIWHYLHRADRISGIGRYGVLFLGLSGGKDLTKPAIGTDKKPLSLAYVRPLAEYHAQIAELETENNPRYGQPKSYNLSFAAPIQEVGAGTAMAAVPQDTTMLSGVHWTRVIHLADNRDDSDIYGIPRMQQHYRRLLDLRKVYAGSAEMYWQGAFPGFSFDANPDLEDEGEMDIETVQEQIQLYMDHLQRYLASTGGTFRSLAPQVVDPTPQIMAYITIICAVLGCPVRIFMGSESGVMASALDKETWNRRIAERQKLYCEPMVIRPLVDRLIDLRVLSKPKDDYKVSFKDLNSLSDADRADVALKRCQSMLQYLSSGGESILPVEFFYTLMLGLSQSECDTIFGMIQDKSRTLHTKELWTATQSAMKVAAKQQNQKTGNEKIRSPQSKVKQKSN